MNWYEDIQVEELLKFDSDDDDLESLVGETKDFSMKEYLNGNIDY